MATGASAQPGRGVATTNVTPGIDFRTGEAELWAAGGRLIEKYTEATRPDMLRRAQVLGSQEGADIANGAEPPKRGLLFFGDAAEARTAALEESYKARVRTDIDRREAEIRQQFRYDPDGYENAASQMRSGFIQGAPPEFAVDVEGYANSLTQRGLEAVAGARTVRDEQEVVQALSVRAARLSEDMIALTARGETESMEFMQLEAEYSQLQTQREGNPAILYSGDQRQQDDERLGDALMLTTINRDALRVYTDNGRGAPGYAAATRFLEDNLLNGEELEGVAPGRLAKMHRDAIAELRTYTVADREERRVEEEAERQRRIERRELVGDYRLRIVLGEATESEILADETLDEADKAGLVRSARTERDRAAREAATGVREAGLEIYRGLMDEAGVGTLTPSDIADARAAGQITPQQARTLRSYNDQSLRPVIEQVMTPVRDYVRRPGMGTRPDLNSRTAIAEEAATRFARDNPDATIEQRMAAGRAIADSVFGSPRAASGTPQQQAGGQAAQLSALAGERQRRQAAGNPMSTSEYNRRRTEIMRGS